MSALLTLFAAAALAAPPAAASPTLDEIVAQHVAARGGRAALAGLRTVRMAGHITEGGKQAIVRREIARPGRIRTEFVFQGVTGVYAWDGSAGWRVSPLDGVLDPKPLPAEEAALAAEQADLDGPLVDWKAKGSKLKLVGVDTLPGGPANHLELTLRSGAVRQLWLDAASGLLVRSLSTRVVRGHSVPLETDFADYRETGGVRFAREVVAGVPGRQRKLRVVVETVETNVPLDEARFSLPR
jgi:hypothetical protein